MSLNPEQKARSSRELQANRQLCPLTDTAICAALGWTPEQLAANLQLGAASHPREVWQLRDFLEQTVRDSGHVPVPFSVMTEDKRAEARGWFGAWSLPATPSSAG